jgi:hypothetical protein
MQNFSLRPFPMKCLETLESAPASLSSATSRLIMASGRISDFHSILPDISPKDLSMDMAVAHNCIMGESLSKTTAATLAAAAAGLHSNGMRKLSRQAIPFGLHFKTTTPALMKRHHRKSRETVWDLNRTFLNELDFSLKCSWSSVKLYHSKKF